MDWGNYGRDERYRPRNQGRDRGPNDDRWRDDADADFGVNYNSSERFNRGAVDYDRGHDRITGPLNDRMNERDRGWMPDDRPRGRMDIQGYGAGRPSDERQRSVGNRDWHGGDTRMHRGGREGGEREYGGRYDGYEGRYDSRSDTRYDNRYDSRSDNRYDARYDNAFGGGSPDGSYDAWTSQGDGTAYEGGDYRQWSRGRGLYGSSEYGGESRENRMRGGVRPQSMRSGTEMGMNQWQGSDSAWGPSRTSHSGKGPKGWTRSDDRIREDVNEALARHDALDASEIEVEVKNGELTLSGTVSEKNAKRMAESIAENVFGVSDVQNSIRVKRERMDGRDDRERQGAGRNASRDDDDSAYASTGRRGEREVGRTTERDTKPGESRTSTDGHDKSRKSPGTSTSSATTN